MKRQRNYTLTIGLTGGRTHVIHDIDPDRVDIILTTLSDGKVVDLTFPKATGNNPIRTVLFPAQVVFADVRWANP